MQIDALAAAGGRRVRLEIVGSHRHRWSAGVERSAQSPSRGARAGGVRAERLVATTLRTSSVGSREPLGDGVLEADKQRNRRVSLRVLPSADVPGK